MGLRCCCREGSGATCDAHIGLRCEAAILDHVVVLGVERGQLQLHRELVRVRVRAVLLTVGDPSQTVLKVLGGVDVLVLLERRRRCPRGFRRRSRSRRLLHSILLGLLLLLLGLLGLPLLLALGQR